MKRPAGVTAAAVVCLVGCALVLLAAAGTFYAAFQPPPSTPATANALALPDYKSMMIGGGTVLVAFALLGITTGVGLLRTRPWARISILVFAGAMALLSFIGVYTVLMVPSLAPPGVDPTMARLFTPMLVAVYAVPLAISVWWLVQFNRPGTRAAFADPEGAPALVPGAPPPRPLSVSVIGWYLVVGGAGCVVAALSGLPSFIFGVLLTGWSAAVLYAVIGAVQLGAGTGVLKLQEAARVVAIGWFLVTLANLLVMAWRPGAMDAMQAYLKQVGQANPAPPFDVVEFQKRLAVIWVVLTILPIWFLVKRRAHFHHHVD